MLRYLRKTIQMSYFENYLENFLNTRFKSIINQIISIENFSFSDGFCYEKSAIEEWFSRGKTTSPMTNIDIGGILEDNTELKNQIDKYLKALDFDPFE